MINILWKMISINGFLWTAHVIPYVLIRKISSDVQIGFLDRRIKYLEKKYNIPGMNSKEINSIIWESWNWEKSAGEEWTKSESWKQSLINEVMLKQISEGSTILEIGPGAGKWTESLQLIADHLTIVDISNKCIEVCKKKFAHCNNITYFVTDGSSLQFIANDSIDFIWSFDVFVHIAPDDIEKYVAEFKRILKSNGKGIIHHAAEGGLHGGWRSSMTKELFTTFLNQNGLTLLSQFDTWGDNDHFNVKYYHDTISIFEKL
ncbi:MAG: class I SAM-dependent methyltransferase [Bacteroidales bacterium]|nr:class I SAM-dependent methyltransferase [Bacteroidales bacterium]